MGTTAKEEKKKGGKGGDKKKEKKSRGPHAGAALPIPAPRLRAFYQQTVRPKLTEQFSFKNPHQVPGLEKIVLNVGLGEAIKQPRLLDATLESRPRTRGHHPWRKKARKSMANLGWGQGRRMA